MYLQLIKDSKDGVPLGQWCLESHLDNRKTILSGFWTNDRKVEIYKRSLLFYKTLLKELVPILNSYHKIEKDEKYYDIVIGKWLFVFSMQVNIRIEELKEASQKLGKFSVSLLKERVIPLEHLDGIQLAKTDIYNHQLYSQILENLDVNFEAEYISKPLHQKIVFKNSVSKAKKYENIFWDILNYISKPKVLITDGYFFYKPFQKKLKLFWKSRGKISHNDMSRNYFVEAEKLDLDFRNYIPKDSSDYEVLKSVTFQNFPILFLEMFSEVRNLALKERKSEIVYSSMGNTYNYLYKFYIAEHKDIKSLYHQHGGSTGIDEVSIAEDYEIGISDIFYTWGWSSGEKTKPLPHPKLDVPIYNSKKESSILFVTNIFPPYMLLFKTQANDPDSFINSYTKEQVEILKRISLPVVLRKKHSNSLFEDEVLKSVKFRRDDMSIPFYKSIQKHRVVFFDHIMTSCLETMAWNIPTIIYLNREKNLFRKEAVKYLELLESVGILHYSIEKATHHLNSFSESWWNSDDVQNAREKFVKQYALTSSNWVNEWIEEFKGVK
jgi:putative transferase (TIGR04331 family)